MRTLSKEDREKIMIIEREWYKQNKSLVAKWLLMVCGWCVLTLIMCALLPGTWKALSFLPPIWILFLTISFYSKMYKAIYAEFKRSKGQQN